MMIKKSKQITYKPGSVHLLGNSQKCSYHLSRPAVACRLMRPTPFDSWLAGTRRAALLQTKSKYTWSCSPQGARHTISLWYPVSSYLTFSPLPCTGHGGCFLLHFYALASIFQLGSVVPCAARTFLTGISRRGRTVICLLIIMSNNPILQIPLLLQNHTP